MKFDDALKIVLQFEGGWTVDTGGPTMAGVTQSTYDRYRKEKGLPKRSVALISPDEIREIYENYYWKPSGADRLPYPLNLVVFDTAVNMGVRRVVNMLKSIVAEYRPQFRFKPYKDYIEFLNQRPLASIMHIARKLLWQRLAFYQRLAKSPKYAKYLKGWTNRVMKLSQIIGGAQK